MQSSLLCMLFKLCVDAPCTLAPGAHSTSATSSASCTWPVTVHSLRLLLVCMWFHSRTLASTCFNTNKLFLCPLLTRTSSSKNVVSSQPCALAGAGTGMKLNNTNRSTLTATLLEVSRVSVTSADTNVGCISAFFARILGISADTVQDHNCNAVCSVLWSSMLKCTGVHALCKVHVRLVDVLVMQLFATDEDVKWNRQ